MVRMKKLFEYGDTFVHIRLKCPALYLHGHD